MYLETRVIPTYLATILSLSVMWGGCNLHSENTNDYER